MKYKIIIPQEEHKQETKCYCGHTTYCDCGPQEEPKQEYQSECICENSCRGFVNVKCKQLKKQESLEEEVSKKK